VRYRLAVVDVEDFHTVSLRATRYVSILRSVCTS
jgi:hypothetical protein